MKLNCLSKRLLTPPHLFPPSRTNLNLSLFRFPFNKSLSSKSFERIPFSTSIHLLIKPFCASTITGLSSSIQQSRLLGMEGDLVDYVLGKKKATEVAHLIWKHIVQKGDTVIDATCGNGYDTLAMVKMVADETGMGRVYGMDIQRDAIASTSSMLDETLSTKEREHVKLVHMCHSRMEEIVPENSPVRLVAFNLGYLPGGDKAITTVSETTLLALEAAKKILVPGGLISLVVYVGHPGGREELETVEAFARGLSVNEWSCSKFQMLNRPVAPVVALMFKR